MKENQGLASPEKGLFESNIAKDKSLAHPKTCLESSKGIGGHGVFFFSASTLEKEGMAVM